MMSLMILLTAFLSPDYPAKVNTNKHFSHSIETELSPAQVWSVWTNVNQWHTWDSGLQKAEMNSAFQKGSKGTLISLEGRRSKFKIVDLDEGRSYTFRTPLLFSSLYVKRYLKTNKGRTTITHEVWFKGLTAGLFANKFGPKFREMLPSVMNKVVEKAQEL